MGNKKDKTKTKEILLLPAPKKLLTNRKNKQITKAPSTKIKTEKKVVNPIQKTKKEQLKKKIIIQEKEKLKRKKAFKEKSQQVTNKPLKEMPKVLKKKEVLVFSPAFVIIIAILFSLLGATIFAISGKYLDSKPIENRKLSLNTSKTTSILNGDVLGETKTFKATYITPPPPVSATSYQVIRILKNSEKNLKMYAKNPNLPLPPASLTKIMTALVAMEDYPLNSKVVMPTKCTLIEGSKAGFKANDTLTLQDMLYGLLVSSGADAACAIANINNESDFIKQMNEKAKTLKLENTVFQNEIGFDAEDKQISTVNDITKMTEEALKSSVFRKIVGTKDIQISSLTTNNKYNLYNTNDLLSKMPGTVGVKTGYTDHAGGCLSYLYENTQTNEQILIILLGSTNHETRFQDTKKLLDWAKSQIILLESNNIQRPQQKT